MEYLNQLNDQQREAVLCTDGPLMILAGAGTGKTKTLTTRIAHIIDRGLAAPWEILAVTFTNKAAEEMRNRVSNILQYQTKTWIGTFHSIANKILRMNAEICGFDRNFTIIDTEEQQLLIKNIAKENMPDFLGSPLRGSLRSSKEITPKYIHTIIQSWKDGNNSYTEMMNAHGSHPIYGKISKIYEIYQEQLKKNNSMDFSDLLIKNIELLNNKDFLEQYQEKFKYIMVDECQDTNIVQYEWIKILANKHKNICCVGDDDQSIYGWRGAQIDNMLNFTKEFTNTKTIKLEQNYRSNSNILNIAASIINNNKKRLEKKIWSDKQYDKKTKIIKFYTREEEANYIMQQIVKIQQEKPLEECAILIRSSSQTRILEEACLKAGISYQIIGNMKFYNRMEIKDMVAYLKVAFNPNDDIALQRIINKPKRGIGDTSINSMISYAMQNNTTIYQSLLNESMDPKITNKTKAFLLNIEKWHELSKTEKPSKLLQTILEESGYKEMVSENKNQDATDVLENIQELRNFLNNFDNIYDFLEQFALNNPADEINNETKIKIMTIHAAKGLEFDSVFLPNWEEGAFPHRLTVISAKPSLIEEERRLAYVAITRAKQNLCISYAIAPNIFEGSIIGEKSRFIDEIDLEEIEKIDFTSGSSSYSNFNNRNYKHTATKYSTTSNKNTQINDYASHNHKLIGKKIQHPEMGQIIVLSIKEDVAEILSTEKYSILKIPIAEINKLLI